MNNLETIKFIALIEDDKGITLLGTEFILKLRAALKYEYDRGRDDSKEVKDLLEE